MKILTHIVFGLVLVWFGGAGLAFATCPGTNTLPACPCSHSHGESGCCCDGNSSEKSAPAYSFNPVSVPLCACNYDRDSSSTTAVTVYRTADPAIVLPSTIVTYDLAFHADNQPYQVLPSSNSPFQPLRI